MKRMPPLDRPSIFRNSRHTARNGFTLMEVLLVTILSAVLMVGLWSLFGTYIRLFESGPERTERAQLLRALKQQFSDDLRGAIQISQLPAKSSPEMTFGSDSAPSDLAPSDLDDGGAAAGTAPLPQSSTSEPSGLPRFGIVGTSQSLAICTLQIPTAALTPPHAADVPVDLSEPTTALAPELKTVLYTFTETLERSPLDHGPPAGLIRRELNWQTALSDHMFASASEFGVADVPAAEDMEEIIDDDSVMWVPEVADLRIRYFGEGRWQNSWDSLQKKSLPSAVEITIEFQDPDESDAAKDVDDKSPMSTSPANDEVVLDNEVESGFITAAENRKPRKRILIYLPGGLPPSQHAGLGFSAADSTALSGGAP